MGKRLHTIKEEVPEILFDQFYEKNLDKDKPQPMDVEHDIHHLSDEGLITHDYDLIAENPALAVMIEDMAVDELQDLIV